MPREVTDDEWNYLQGRRQVADLADSVWNDPQLGNAARALLKTKMPNLQIPDFDIRNEMYQRLNEQEQKREEEKAAERRARDEAYWQTEREKVRKQYNFTDEGLQNLEKFMLEKNIGDYEVAATYQASKNPKPSEPSSYKDPYWNHTKSDTFKQIAADPEEWGRSEILKALHNDQQNRNKGGF